VIYFVTGPSKYYRNGITINLPPTIICHGFTETLNLALYKIKSNIRLGTDLSSNLKKICSNKNFAPLNSGSKVSSSAVSNKISLTLYILEVLKFTR
jgi:hypothetical protein